MKIKKLHFDDAYKLLKEGDVLLFRGNSLLSFFIKRAGEGVYSHVGIASQWKSGSYLVWECVEFKEFVGSRCIDLKRYVEQNNGLIDVFRADPIAYRSFYNETTKLVEHKKYDFNGRCISDKMRSLTGMSYGWKSIWRMAQLKIPFLRLFYNMNQTIYDDIQQPDYLVCSSSISYAFNVCGFDLVPNKADQFTEPSDLARSSLLNYLFTLTV